jgi:hypothetical protein
VSKTFVPAAPHGQQYKSTVDRNRNQDDRSWVCLSGAYSCFAELADFVPEVVGCSFEGWRFVPSETKSSPVLLLSVEAGIWHALLQSDGHAPFCPVTSIRFCLLLGAAVIRRTPANGNGAGAELRNHARKRGRCCGFPQTAPLMHGFEDIVSLFL